MIVGDAPVPLSQRPQLVLNLGGPSGTYSVERPGSPPSTQRDFVTPMLCADPVAFIDEIDRALGLPSPVKLDLSSPATWPFV